LSEAEFPPTERSYQLRFTHRALDDLRCPGLVPSDLEGVQAATPWPGIVHDFREQRGDSPETTGGALANMGRGDIYPLHGPAGGRAATWYDEQSEVCWFLGFTPAHDYAALETRAANDDLLPDPSSAAQVGFSGPGTGADGGDLGLLVGEGSSRRPM
jgi:hypothetical protein